MLLTYPQLPSFQYEAAIAKTKYTITLHKLPAGSSPEYITTGPDKNLWFGVSMSDGTVAVGKYVPEKGPYKTFPYTVTNFLSRFAPGPDGNVWFTDFDCSINSITPAGKITTYSVPSCGQPVGVGTGPDDRVWFTGAASSQVGNLDLANNAFQTFATKSSGANPLEIVTGPDKDLWFTEYYADKVARVTVKGVVTEYDVPTGGAGPDSITVGPDGALWFTEYNVGQIGRVTTAGKVTEYKTSGSGTTPIAITTGADGNLWFTEYSASALGVMTPKGAYAEIKLKNGSGPDGMTLGSDKAIWFTAASGGYIGSVVPKT
jgi:virginiamycin B lyase